MKLKELFLATLWLAKEIKGFARFTAKNPKGILAASGFIISELRNFSRKIRKTNVDKERDRLKGKLRRCTFVYEKKRAHIENHDFIRYMEEDSEVADISPWGNLYIAIRALRPRIVVETGVDKGASTSYILKALSANGKGFLYSIDLPNQCYRTSSGEIHVDSSPPRHESGYLIPPKLKGRWKLVLGNTWHTLPPLLDQLGQIDLFLHDSEHTYETMAFEFETAWAHLSAGGLLVSDDATWNESLSDFAQRHAVNLKIIKGQGLIRKPSNVLLGGPHH